VAAFQQRHALSSHPGFFGYVHLAPPCPLAGTTDRQADTKVVLGNRGQSRPGE
jgi:hypothetical protein